MAENNKRIEISTETSSLEQINEEKHIRVSNGGDEPKEGSQEIIRNREQNQNTDL